MSGTVQASFASSRPLRARSPAIGLERERPAVKDRERGVDVQRGLAVCVVAQDRDEVAGERLVAVHAREDDPGR
jgi:hypothetical protein